MSEGGCKIGKDFIGKIGYGSLGWVSGNALSGFGSWEAHEDMDDIKE